MTDSVIQVENVSKRYTLGGKADGARYHTLRESVTNALQAPLRRLRRPTSTPAAAAADNEVWALLLKVLSRITEPTAGRIRLKGRVASLLEVGTGFHPELTGRENIYLNGAILGMHRHEIKAKFDEIVAFAEVEKFLDTPVKRYSSGMYVRLACAVAAHLEPEILIVDEVLAVGDAQFQEKCLGKMKDVSRHGRTVLFVSHNMSAVQALCRRSILMVKGGVKMDGTSTEVTSHYLGEFLHSNTASANGVFNLRQRKNQHSQNGLLIVQVTIRNQDGVGTSRIRMGCPMIVEIETENLQRYPNPIVGFHLLSVNNELLADFNTDMSVPAAPSNRTARECYRLHVPRLPFVQGTYLFGIAVASRTTGLLDFVEPVGTLHITEFDTYGTGYQIPAKHSLVLLDGSWEISAVGGHESQSVQTYLSDTDPEPYN